MKKLNRKTIIISVILVVLFVFIVTIGVLVYKNRNTILAIYYTYTNQTVKLEQKKLDTDKRALEAIKEFGIDNVRLLTEEETEMLNKGELTEEQAVNIILGRTEETQGTEGNETSDSSDTQQTDSNIGNAPQPQQGTTTKPEEKPETSTNNSSDINKEKNDEIAELIGELYVLKAKFSSELEAVEKWVNDTYWGYTVEYGAGNEPESIKIKIGKEAYNRALALEEECDLEVNRILDKIRVLLKETGQDEKLIEEIKLAYDNEKMLAKSKYMEQAQ